MKETFYFSHDYNARTDDKIKKLVRKHWVMGYWTYWCIIEDLYNNANVLQLDYEGISYDLRISEEVVKSIINDFGLFVKKWSEFYSKSVWDRLKKREEKSAKARESANKRWWNKNANAYKTWCDSNAIKERKIKESKVIGDFLKKITNASLKNKIEKELWYYLDKYPNKRITIWIMKNIKESCVK